MRRAVKMFAALVLLGAGLAVWAVLIEPGWVRYREYPVELANWPADLAGFKIAVIADTHVGSPHISLGKLEEIVAQTNALSPDLVLLCGDYVIQGVLGRRPVPSQDIAAALAGLKARHGVFAVMGNHDWWESAPRMIAEFEAAGIRVLEDAATRIAVGTEGIWLVGVSDFTEGAHNVSGALATVTGAAPIILLTHSPDIFPEVPSKVALSIAGHTHGGQVYVPFLGRPVIPSKYGQRYAMGLIEEEGKVFFVSPGIGTSILPVRFMTPPEVSILRINPAD